MKAGKVWGHTESLFQKNNVEIHRIVILPGGFCSKHMHRHKHNAFYCERGEIWIDVWKKDYALVDTTRLGPGEICSVAPGEYHRFRTDKDCGAPTIVVYEIYWTELDASDIVREDHGGV